MKYTATIQFEIFDFKANDLDEADDKIDEFISKLATVNTKLHWDNVDWDIYELTN